MRTAPATQNRGDPGNRDAPFRVGMISGRLDRLEDGGAQVSGAVVARGGAEQIAAP